MTHSPTEALEVFSVLGSSHPDFQSEKLQFFCVAGWESPSFSPLVLLPGKDLGRADLSYIEAFFQKHPIANKSLNPAPYFNFFAGEGLYDTSAIQTVCSEAGWNIDKDPLSIEFVQLPMAMEIPPGLQVSIIETGKSGLQPEYEKMLISNFNADDIYLQSVARAFRNTDALSYTVLLRFINGEWIGGGTISIRDSLGFLTWGCINEEHRNQGFHRLLLSACSTVALSHGVRKCSLTTRNKLIRGRWHRCIEMYICRKDQPKFSGATQTF